MTSQEIWARANVIGLAFAMWRESRNQPRNVRIGVGCALMDRVRRPSWWGKTVSGVLFKKWQISSLTDPNDPQLAVSWPLEPDKIFEECVVDAEGIIDGTIPHPLPGSDSYYDDSLQGEQIPKWARDNPQRFVGKLGRMNFYNMDGLIGVQGSPMDVHPAMT